jgi:hypothetical protein
MLLRDGHEAGHARTGGPLLAVAVSLLTSIGRAARIGDGIRCNLPTPPGVEYPSFRGVLTTHIPHGSRRVGTPLMLTRRVPEGLATLSGAAKANR